MHRKRMGIAVGTAAAIALALSACGGGASDTPEDPAAAGQSQNPNPADQAAAGEQAAPEPDLEGIPDVVAEVNGAEITKDDFTAVYESQFQQVAMQAQSTGEQLDQDQLKNDTAESMIGVELLTQEATDRGIEVSDEDVTGALTETAESNQMSADEFLAAMEQQGMAEGEVLDQLSSMLTVERVVGDEHGPFEATEDEVATAYEQATSQQEQMGQASGQSAEMPPLEDVRPQLEEQVTSQKQAEATDTFAAELRSEGDITIHL